MLNSDGFVAECAGDNLFIFHHGILFLRPWRLSLHGITRNTVMELAQEWVIRSRSATHTTCISLKLFPDQQRSRCARCQN